MPWCCVWFGAEDEGVESKEDEGGGYSLGVVEVGYSPLVVVVPVVVVVVEL